MNKDLTRLNHILQSIDDIIRFTNNGDKDNKTQAAVERKIEIIGEACKNISSDILKQYPNIPWKDIMGMRDILVHEYFRVENEAIWYTVEHKIPALRDWIEGIIEEYK